MESQIRNAVIEQTMLGIEDHGLLTVYVHLDYGDGGHQGFGGYGLDRPVKIDGKHSHREGTAYGMEFISQIMKVAGVAKWEDLVGQHVRVDGRPFGQIKRIGHIIEDKWFHPEEDLKHLIPEEVSQ
jgi:hypothetical protein